MFPVVLLILIIAYEIFRAIKLEDYIVVNEVLKGIKNKESKDKEYVDAGELFLNNKRYFLYIGFEYLYLIILTVLLFTPYIIVALLITIQGFIVHYINKKVNKPVTYLDSVVTIAIIILGLIFI